MAKPDLGSNIPDKLDGDEAPAPAPVKAKSNTTRIILERSTDIPPTGLPIGLNGDVILIVPGHPVDIPNEYLRVLDEAITEQPVLDPSTGQIIGSEPRQRFAYRYA